MHPDHLCELLLGLIQPYPGANFMAALEARGLFRQAAEEFGQRANGQHPSAAQALSELREVVSSPWEIRLGAFGITRTSKHLFAALRSTALDAEFLRLDGSCVNKSALQNNIIDTTFSLTGAGETFLLGMFSDPRQPILGDDKGDGSNDRLPIFRGSYADMLNYIENASALVVHFARTKTAYRLFSCNSNSFLAAAQEHCLGDQFNRLSVIDALATRSWRAPGFDDSLPEIPNLAPRARSETPSTATELVAHHAERYHPDTVSQAVSRMVITLATPLLVVEQHIATLERLLHGTTTMPMPRGATMHTAALRRPARHFD